MCCEPIGGSPADTVGACKDCGMSVDKEGDTTEEGCFYSPVCCDTCGYKPCDQSC